MGRLDEMRAALARPGQKPPAPTTDPEPAPEPEKAKKKTKSEKRAAPEGAPEAEAVTFQCGHRFGCGHFQNQACPACRNAKRSEKAAAKRAAKTAQPKPPCLAERLPAGSVKLLMWDGAMWQGELTIPGVPDVFRFTAESEKKCYHGLHNAWIAWRNAQAKQA